MNEYNTYTANNNIVYSCKYHVVWCPKYRRKLLVGDVEKRLKELLQEKAEDINVTILEMEVMPDHLHLLIEVDPQYGVNHAIKTLKGYTAHYLNIEFPHLRKKVPTIWTNSYFVSTVGGAPLDAVKKYIENQKTSCRANQKGKMG